MTEKYQDTETALAEYQARWTAVENRIETLERHFGDFLEMANGRLRGFGIHLDNPYPPPQSAEVSTDPTAPQAK
jgi:hypothetical protein